MRHIPWHWNEAAIRETTSYCAVQAWLEEATNTPGLWALIGPPGVGKTFGAVSYAIQNQVDYICPTPRKSDTPTAFARELCSVLGVVSTNGSPIDALYAHCENARVRLIIDEAVRLSRTQLELIRDLSDRYPIAVVLVGTDNLARKLAYYDTIVHRIAGVFQVPPLTLSDLRMLIGDAGVAESVYKRTGGNWRYICRILERLDNYPVQTPGVVHEIADQVILDPARFKTQKNGGS
jgi:hypothetical protein